MPETSRSLGHWLEWMDGVFSERDWGLPPWFSVFLQGFDIIKEAASAFTGLSIISLRLCHLSIRMEMPASRLWALCLIINYNVLVAVAVVVGADFLNDWLSLGFAGLFPLLFDFGSWSVEVAAIFPGIPIPIHNTRLCASVCLCAFFISALSLRHFRSFFTYFYAGETMTPHVSECASVRVCVCLGKWKLAFFFVACNSFFMSPAPSASLSPGFALKLWVILLEITFSPLPACLPAMRRRSLCRRSPWPTTTMLSILWTMTWGIHFKRFTWDLSPKTHTRGKKCEWVWKVVPRFLRYVPTFSPCAGTTF